jgi:uncharacterized membrane protein YebE (DUF533 family)
MATTSRTKPRSPGTARFARAGASPGRRAARSTARTSPYARVRSRRQPQKTGIAKAIEMLPTGAAGKAAGSKSGKAGGFAALAAAAGLAFRNRDKLGGLLNRTRGKDAQRAPQSPETPTAPPGVV